MHEENEITREEIKKLIELKVFEIRKVASALVQTRFEAQIPELVAKIDNIALRINQLKRKIGEIE